MNNIHVKTGDTVVVLSGKDKGKQGKVLEVSPKEKKVIVEGVKVVTVNTLCVYDILNCDSFVVLKDAAKKIEEVYA